MCRILHINKFSIPANNSQCVEFYTLDGAGIEAAAPYNIYLCSLRRDDDKNTLSSSRGKVRDLPHAEGRRAASQSRMKDLYGMYLNENPSSAYNENRNIRCLLPHTFGHRNKLASAILMPR